MKYILSINFLVYFQFVFLSVLTFGQSMVTTISPLKIDMQGADSVFSMTIGKDNIYWIATNKGLLRFDGETSTLITSANSKLPSNQLRSVKISEDGSLWIGSADMGIFKMNTAQELLLHIKLDNYGDKIYPISCITFDKKGGKWVGTHQGGLWYIDGQDYEFFYNTENCDIKSNQINSIAIDKEGAVWVATQKGIGLTRNGFNWIGDFMTGDANAVILDTENNAIVNMRKSDKNLLYYNKKALKDVSISLGNFNDYLNYDGEVWVATNGILYFNGSDWKKYDASNSEFKEQKAICIAVDTKGNIIVASPLGNFYKVSNSITEEPQDSLTASVKEEPKDTTKIVEPITTIKTEETFVFKGETLSKGKSINLHNVLFAPQGHQFSDTTGVYQLYLFMRDNPKVVIELTGHTDKDLPKTHPQYAKVKEMQMELSQKRVNNVARFLTDRNIAKERIQLKWFGGMRPISYKESLSHLNRRVEMKIIDVLK